MSRPTAAGGREVDGRGVHLMLNEHTLCGDAYDGHQSEADWERGEMRATNKRTVTCPDCVAIILECKSARVRREGA